jgi:hypothetical protein
VSLDDPTLRELAVTDPKLFLDRFPPPLLIDEIQYAPGVAALPQAAYRRRARAGSLLAHWVTAIPHDARMRNPAGSDQRRSSESLKTGQSPAAIFRFIGLFFVGKWSR